MVPALSCVVILVIFAACLGTGLWLLAGGRSPRQQHPLCGHCGYDLTGSTSNRCPECGRLFIDAGVRTSALERRPRARIAAGIVLLVVGALFLPCLATSLMFMASGRAAVRSQIAAQRLAAAAAAAQAYSASPRAQATQAQDAEQARSGRGE